MKTFVSKLLSLLLIIACGAFFQNFESVQIQASPAKLINTPYKTIISDSRTIHVSIPELITQSSSKLPSVLGDLTYPSRKGKDLIKMDLKSMHLFYTCIGNKNLCTLTFKIPEHQDEMDLSKLYSQSPVLQISILSPLLPQKDVRITLNKNMIQESLAKSQHVLGAL